MTDTPTSLRVLILADHPDDAELLVRELRHANYDPDWELVATEQAYLAQLDPALDVILADYSMPGFSGVRALRLLRERGLDIPFIIVSDMAGEDAAVAAMLEGAADYLLKARLSRLGPAVIRALENRLLLKEGQIKRQLHKTENQLASILEYAAESIVAINKAQKIIVFNKAAEKTFGYSALEALGQPLDLLIPDRLMEVHRKHFQNFAASPERSRPIEHRQGLVARRKDGSEFPVEIGLSKLETDDGIIFTAMIVDISERKRAEEAVQQMQDRFRALTENAPDGIALIDQDGRLKFVSPSARKIFGYSRDENPEIDPAEHTHPDDLPAVLSALSDLIETPTQNPTLQYRFKHKDGSWIWIESTFTNLLSVKNVEAIVVNFRDITERRRAEEKIQQQLQRITILRKIDQAITGSTDLRYMLTIVLGHVKAELGVDAAAILLYDPIEKVLKHELGMGMLTNALNFRSLKLGDGYAGKAALTRQTVSVSELQTRETDFLRYPTFSLEGFACYFGVPLIAKDEIKGVLEIFHRSPLEPERDWFDYMETLGGQLAIAIDNATLSRDLQRSNVELLMAYDATIEGWSKALDLRDKETEGHTQRVTEMTIKLARIIGVDEEEIVHIKYGALLHDIGKMGVPDRILLKPDKLTEQEWEIMRKHPTFAYELLSPIRYLKSAAIDIPYCHHEKWDGSGFPRGLKGEEIPLAARIFAVVDVWDALTSDRPYRPAWSRKRALGHIKEQSGLHFDPVVVEAFLKLLAGD